MNWRTREKIHGNSREFTGDFSDKRTGGVFMNWRTREKIHGNSRKFTGGFQTEGQKKQKSFTGIHENSREVFRQKEHKKKITGDERDERNRWFR